MAVGSYVGFNVRSDVGCGVGVTTGLSVVGNAVGNGAVLFDAGCCEGPSEGSKVSSKGVGFEDGSSVRRGTGSEVGSGDNWNVGKSVGSGVGIGVRFGLG